MGRGTGRAGIGPNLVDGSQVAKAFDAMKIRIHRGTKEIGGTCIEMEAQGKRIALDVGLPLDASGDVEVHKSLLPQVPGFREPDESLLGVLISHPHMDHYGLARYVRPEVPVYIGEGAHNVMKAATTACVHQGERPVR